MGGWEFSKTLLWLLGRRQLYRRCYTVYTFPTIPCRATAALQEMLHCLYVAYYSLQSYSSTTGDATQSIDLQWLYRRCYTAQNASYYSLQSYFSSTGNSRKRSRLCSISCRATVDLQTVLHLLQCYCSSTGNSGKSIDSVASPVALLQLYREQQETYRLCSISCRATVALQGIVGNIQTVQHLLQSYCSSTGKRIDQQETYRLCSISCRATVALEGIVGNVQTVQHGNSRKRVDCVASPVELLWLYREQQETYRQCSISCRATVAPQGIVGNVYTVQHLLQSEQQETYRLCSISCRATVALQGNVQTVQHLLQSYSSSTGNSRKRIECVASPVELQQGITRNVQTVQHLLQSYCSSTGNSGKRIDSVASPVQLLKPYREQQETYRLRSISCRATVALQVIAGNDCVASPVELLQPYREQQEPYRLCNISCGATVALQGIVGNVQTVQHLLCSISCRATVSLQGIVGNVQTVQHQGTVGNVQTVQHLLQSYSSSTGKSRRRAECPVELLQQETSRLCSISCRATVALQELLYLYREQQETYRLCSISCRATLALQGIVGSVLGCVASPVEPLQIYRLCCISCSATVALQGIVGKVQTVQHLLQRCCSSTGNSRKRIDCVASPVELLQLYREQQETYRLCSISCRATVALQGIVGNVQTVQHLLQSYCSSTGKRIDQQETYRLCSISCRATVALEGIVGNVQTVQHGNSRKRVDCVASPVELLWLYREQQETYRQCSISCRATVAPQGIVGNVQTVQHLLQSYCTGNVQTVQHLLQSYCSSTGNSRNVQTVQNLQLYREQQETYRFCRASLQGMQSYCRATVTGNSRKRIDCVASRVELLQLYREQRKRIDCAASPVELVTGNSRKRIDCVASRRAISCRATSPVALQGIVYREQQETYRLCSISCRATVALQGIAGNVQTVQHLLYCSSTGNSRKRIDSCVASPVELLQLYREQQGTYRLCSISCRATVALQGIVGNVQTVQHLLQSHCRSTDFCCISCSATVALQGIVRNVQTVQHLLQSYCSSTGNSRKRKDCVASPVGLLYLYREQQETYRLCSISCRATVALQGIVGNVQTVQHLLQSYCSSTGNSRKRIDCVASPVELLQLYREQSET